MAIGIMLRVRSDAANAVDDLIDQARTLFDSGVRQVWLSQQFQHDAIASAAVIGAAVPGLGVGTAAVPMNPRHPLVVASLAQTAQAAGHGNFTLGLGLGSHGPERTAFGVDWPHPAARLREYLQILRSILDTGTVDFHGEVFTASPDMPVTVAGGTPLPVLVAAMGPKALEVTGELADGTLPNLAGPRTIEEFIRPAIEAAAARAGRPSPRIIAQVPVVPAADTAAGRDIAAQALAFYQTIPSYARVIAREGVASVADLAAVGSPEAIARHLSRYRDAGATDLILNPIDPSSTADVWQIAATLR